MNNTSVVGQNKSVVPNLKYHLFMISFTAANTSLILYSLLALIKPDILLEPFSLHVYQFPEGAINATAYLAALFRLIGFFNLILGMLGLLILRQYMVTRQEWLLKIVIASTALSYLGPIVFDNTVGTIGFFEILEHILFAMVIVLGFVMLKYKEAV